ncbi:3712_t:CDS:2 [Funneliformis mosseae]|uniref:3712_t:CDS:1 n=1 Tax=Funneliformis mosseae TaxID=27381 RepID=A0A9N9GXA2_FUNMO|nr:3712_t:CDS:2 [Funneliformis mosseae]
MGSKLYSRTTRPTTHKLDSRFQPLISRLVTTETNASRLRKETDSVYYKRNLKICNVCLRASMWDIWTYGRNLAAPSLGPFLNLPVLP